MHHHKCGEPHSKTNGWTVCITFTSHQKYSHNFHIIRDVSSSWQSSYQKSFIFKTNKDNLWSFV